MLIDEAIGMTSPTYRNHEHTHELINVARRLHIHEVFGYDSHRTHIVTRHPWTANH